MHSFVLVLLAALVALPASAQSTYEIPAWETPVPGSFITLANIYATTGMAGSGLLTTVWVTAIIVGSNVIIFVMVPQALRRAAPRRAAHCIALHCIALHCIALHTRHIA